MTSDMNKLTDAWETASRELAIKASMPFSFEVDGRLHRCVAWLPDFGGKGGMVVVAICPPDFERDPNLFSDAKTAGYYASAINLEEYRDFDRERYIEMLQDWGFFGPPEARPAWL